MPRTPRNPGSGKPPCNGPATGAGWGGPARGAGNGNSRSVITPENTADLAALHGTPEVEAKRARRIATAEELKGVLSEIALDGDAPHLARIQAADKMLNRIEGMPVQRNLNINADADRSPDDIASELDAIRTRRARVAVGAGAVAPGVPEQPGRLVH